MEQDWEKMEARVSLKRSRMDFEDDESRDGSEYGVSDDTEEERWSEDESEDVDEQEVENHEYTTPGDTSRMVNIRLFFTEEETGGFKWMKNCVAKCTCDGVVVATALARYIYRESMRSEFWENMEEPSEETCGMAYDVFDRYGTLKTKYKDHPVQRGTGVWGNELDHGPLFLIEVLHVKALDLRRKGLGQKVVSLLLQKAQQRCLDEKEDRKRKHMDIVYGSKEAFEREWTPHALVSPGILTADIESQSVGRSAEERLMIRTRIQSGAIDFWRSCGFRRIGASRCFAFSFDLHHQSRVLTAAADFDPRSSHAKDLEDEELEVIYKTDSSTDLGKLKMGRLRDALPLHHAALTLTDEELKAFFVNHSGDETGWNRVTNSKATLLHLTACELKPQSTQWLLDNVHHAESWKTARDIDGYTPLESLQEKLEIMRTRIVHGFFRVSNISDHFRGNPDTAVSCLSLLLGQEASALNKEYLRYGCICGECVRGFLSARMRSSLIVQGETAYDFMQDGIEDGGFWVEFNDHRLEHLDSDVRENLKTNKSLRKGFANLFQIAVECLKAKRAPVAANLEWYCKSRSEWPPYIKSYLRRAGTRMGCRAVLREMFDAAMNEDEKAGNGECQRILKKEWSDLPTCRNDHEFEFVARACGYSGDDSISVPCW